MKQKIKVLTAYFRAHRAIYLIWVLLLLLEEMTLFLYDQAWPIFLDTILFSLLLISSYFIFSFSKWHKKIQQLQLLLENFSKELLPPRQDQLEALYQQIAINLADKLLDEQENERLKKQEMLADFGIWLHQIKTPVFALDLLCQAQNNEQMRAEIFKINEYLELMLNYLRQQLDNSDLVFEKVNLEQLVKQVLKKYALFFAQKNLRLEFGELDLQVTTDSKWLTFILEQVIFNAIKYTKTGTIKVGVVAGKLQISDTGIGIKAEDLPRIFEKGFTGYNGRQDKRASGLGLYLSKQIAAKLGCELTVTSKVDHGTTVGITFPQQN